MTERPDLSELRLHAYDHDGHTIEDAADWIEAVEDVLRLYIETGGRCSASWIAYTGVGMEDGRCCGEPGHDGDHDDEMVRRWNDSNVNTAPSPWTSERLAVLQAVKETER